MIANCPTALTNLLRRCDRRDAFLRGKAQEAHLAGDELSLWMATAGLANNERFRRRVLDRLTCLDRIVRTVGASAIIKTEVPHA